MKTYIKFTLFLLMLAALAISAQARTKEQSKNKKQEGSQVLRTTTGTFDLQRNKVSNIDMYTTNYGLIGHNAATSKGGGIWPRGSNNQYIFGGGIWFAAKKVVRGDTALLCEISYNPNSASSWLAPGVIEDGDGYFDEFNKKYRVYFSTDFNEGDGIPSNLADGPNWPLWDNSTNPLDTLMKDRYVGNYVFDVNKRNKSTYSKGPAFISQEDIFAVFKDTDLSRYEGGVETRRSQGYPLRLQYEQMIYSWGFGDYKDFMFIKYMVINKSTDTLFDCWAASAFDMDIATAANSNAGAENDHTRYVDEVDSLNLAIQWSGTNRGEAGKGFGYIGFDFLESPAVDTINHRYIRQDKKSYKTKEQIGLKTFRNWPITVDPSENAERYNFVSSGDKDGDVGGAGDKRFLMSTGPFHLRPNDTARIVVGLMFASTEKGQDATGSFSDLINLIRIDTFAQAVYDNNYKTPKAPDAAYISYRPLNNAVLISWDSTSEMSYDPLEEGMDFLGYKLYRARRDDLDTFNVDYQPNAKKGPFGWKQIAEWKMDFPFLKSQVSNGSAPGIAFFDSVRIVSQLNATTFIVTRFANHATSNNPLGTNQWGKYFAGLSRQERTDLFTGKIIVDTLKVTSNRPTWGSLTSPLPWPVATLPSGEVVYLPWYPVSGGQFKLADSIKYVDLTKRLNELLNSGQATMVFPNLEPDSNVRKKIRQEVIIPYMNSITNNSTYIDIGDDNHDGAVNEDVDPALTEKLLNNVQYFYKLTAWDEGDYKISSPVKVNTGIKDRNQISAYPGAAPAGNKTASVQIVAADTNLLGGLYNFQFKVLDQERFNQLFTNVNNEGHELELEFQPQWGTAFYPPPTNESPNPPIWGLYQREITLRDKTSGKTLFKGTTYLEPVLGLPFVQNRAPELFTENAATYIGSDTLKIDTITGEQKSFGVPTDKGKILRIGRFTTEKTGDDGGTYSSLIDNEAKQTLGFSFDYGIQQQGGKLRIDTVYVSNNTNAATTHVTYASSDIGDPISLAERVDTVFDETGAGRIIFGSYNNGPAQYEIEFTAGGTEILSVPMGNTGTKKNFTVNYLTMKVNNKISYKRVNENGDSVTVGYPLEIPLAIQNVTAPEYPIRTEVPIGAYDLSAFGWINARVDSSAGSRAKQAAGFVGQQGRYYLSTIMTDSVGKVDTLDFVHIFQASGAELGFDYANRARRDRSSLLWEKQAHKGHIFGNDFQAGDKIQFNITGGALGMPLPGAKIAAKIISSVPKIDEYTDDMMDQIRVVPNPYFVTDQIQRSPYDAKIFFTKLPKQCTISIYTINGELIKKFEHNELTSPEPEKYAVEVWDLIASSKQRVASQTLIAKIETPNGANSIQKFSVVVGSSRVVPE